MQAVQMERKNHSSVAIVAWEHSYHEGRRFEYEGDPFDRINTLSQLQFP